MNDAQGIFLIMMWYCQLSCTIYKFLRLSLEDKTFNEYSNLWFFLHSCELNQKKNDLKKIDYRYSCNFGKFVWIYEEFLLPGSAKMNPDPPKWVRIRRNESGSAKMNPDTPKWIRADPDPQHCGSGNSRGFCNSGDYF